MDNAKEIVRNVLHSNKGIVWSKDDVKTSMVRASRGGKIIFHNITSGGVEWLGQREAVKRVSGMISDGWLHN